MTDTHEPQQPHANRQLTYAEMDAIYAQLRKVREDCRTMGMNRHGSAIVLIAECIDKGFNTGRRITSALSALGYDKRQVGILLSENTGDDPQLHGWRRDDDGFYTTHSPPTAH